MRFVFMLALVLNGVLMSAQTDGLIAYYPFEGNGNDLSGNENHGVPFGKVLYEQGVVGKAAVFDGKTTFFEILPKDQLPKVGDFTITTWVMVQDFPRENAGRSKAVRSYLFNGHTGHRKSRNFMMPGFSLILDQKPGEPEEFHNFILPYRGTSRGSVEQAITCKVKGFWRCVTFVRSGSEITTYVDGEELDNRFVARRANVTAQTLDMNHYWYIGTFSGNNKYYYQLNQNTYNFKGLLDEMRIFNRALSAEEVMNICNVYAK